MNRINFHRDAPEALTAIRALDTYVKSKIEHELIAYLKLRASQLNGCGYCVDYHATALIDAGVPTRKVMALSVWRDTDFFTAREQAVLELTEEVTFIEGGVSDETWNRAASHFTAAELGDLIVAIGLINTWNRIGVATHMTPPPL